MTEQNRKWSESPIHDQVKRAGLDNAGEAQSLSAPTGSHICDECKGLLDGYFTGRMHLDGFDVRMKCQKCGKEETVKFTFENTLIDNTCEDKNP